MPFYLNSEPKEIWNPDVAIKEKIHMMLHSPYGSMIRKKYRNEIYLDMISQDTERFSTDKHQIEVLAIWSYPDMVPPQSAIIALNPSFQIHLARYFKVLLNNSYIPNSLTLRKIHWKV